MASTNQSPFYQKAEKEYLEATSDEGRIACLEIMIRECPKHKSSENMLKNLTNRLKKLREGVERRKRAGKGGKQGIKKSEAQCVVVGPVNTGKSFLFKILTGIEAKISPHPFTTSEPQVGTFRFEDVQVQIIDSPPFPNHDKGLVNSADTIVIVVDNLNQIKTTEEFVQNNFGERILVYNKINLVSENEKRKIEATLKSKFREYDFVLFSGGVEEVNELKKKIFLSFPIIRVYTKEPKKEPSKDPMILKKDSAIKDAIEKIRKGMSNRVKTSRVWGPSSKFSGQVVGLEHKLKDRDVIEFKTG